MKTGDWGLAGAPAEGSVDGPVAPRGPRTGRRDDDAIPLPPPVRMLVPRLHGFTQEQARERRSMYLEVQYDDFDLIAEVRDQLSPLAAQVSSALQRPVVARARAEGVDGNGVSVGVVPGWRCMRREVDAVAAAVSGVWSEVVKMLTERGRLSGDVRACVAAVARGGAELAVSDGDLESGSWAEVLVGRVAPLSVGLAALLGDSSASYGCVSPVSERLHGALQPLDRAVSVFQTKIWVVLELQKSTARARAEYAKSEVDRERRELAELGLS